MENSFIDQEGDYALGSSHPEYHNRESNIVIFKNDSGYTVIQNHPRPVRKRRMRVSNPVQDILQNPKIIFDLMNAAIAKEKIEIPESVMNWSEENKLNQEDEEQWQKQMENYKPCSTYACKDLKEVAVTIAKLNF